MPVQMQLSRIIISEISDNQVVFLQEVDGTRQFPIMIGMFEAASIDRRIKSDFKPVRPLTVSNHRQHRMSRSGPCKTVVAGATGQLSCRAWLSTGDQYPTLQRAVEPCANSITALSRHPAMPGSFVQSSRLHSTIYPLQPTRKSIS